MARKCSSPGCAISLPDKYPLDKCPWHLAPGRGPVKIAAAVAIAAAGFGGGMAYKKFRAYLRDKQSHKQVAAKRSSQKQPRTRKRSATKPKRQPRKGISEIEGKAATVAAKE